MAHLDVYKYGINDVDFLVDVQTNFLEHLETRVCVPLVKSGANIDTEFPNLKPIIMINGHDYIFSTTDITVVYASNLQSAVANLETDYYYDIQSALDFLFQGF